jgi:uncharacterized protein (DUF885 family)
MGHTTDDFSALKEEFFDEYLRREPEEATTLGRRECDGSLKAWSFEHIADETRAWRRLCNRLNQLDARRFPPDDQIDHEHLRALAEFHVRIYDERQEHLWNIHASTYPYVILQYQLLRAKTKLDWERLTLRIGEIPRFLREQERNLRAGLEYGLSSARKHVENTARMISEDALIFFKSDRLTSAAERVLSPAWSQLLRRLIHEAASAHKRHASFLRRELLPKANGHLAIGRTEYRWRLRNVLGVREEPEEVAELGRSQLMQSHAAMVEQARRLDPSVRDLQGAFNLLLRFRGKYPQDDTGVLELYSRLTDRARAFIEKQRLFRIPGALQLDIMRTPPGMEVSLAANWPAPLLDSSGKGHFLVSLTHGPADHADVDAAALAVHEGVPGHYLQSFVWQQRYSRASAPIRFLLVADDVNTFRNHWGTNVNIEGFALYAEQLMLSQGFYSSEEALAALASQAFRAARLVLDVGLHLGQISVDAAGRYLREQALLSELDARREAIRYTNYPLQATTYMIGRLQIERLKDAYSKAQGSAFSEAGFHERFFSYGPLRPDLIAHHMLSTTL